MGKRLPIKVLLAGCDPEVQLRVAPALAKAANGRTDPVELAAVYGAAAGHAQSAAQAFGFKAHGADLNELFRTAAPSVVVAAVPTDQAVAEISALLAYKAPMLLVPPLGKSLDDILAMSEAARKSGARPMVAMSRRFSPYLCRAVQWGRQLGPIKMVRAHLRAVGQVDGPFIWNSGVHAIDAIASILGRIEGVELRVPKDSAAAAVSLRFANQTCGQVELAGGAEHTQESYEIIGEGYQAVVVLQALAGPSMQCWRGPKIEVRIQAPAAEPAIQHDGMFEAMMAFFDAVAAQTKLSPTLEDVLPAFDLAQRLIGELAAATTPAAAPPETAPLAVAVA
jgi:predicted dehydrogenase